ncbi:MAG: hypothetical protein J6D30_04395 [Clostridia bacterium]|nr:hypothetical protein [Clostridia bacterium]
MKTWKQRWEDELDAKIPPLLEEVKNEPIAAITTDTTQESSTFWQGIADVWQRLVNNVKTYRKRWMTAAASCMAAIVALCVCLPYLFPSAPVLAQTTVLALEINPQVFFSVDETGNVTAAVAGNEDADVILSSKERLQSLVGKSAQEASAIFVDYAAQLGYLNLEGMGAVKITVCGEDTVLKNVGNNMRSYLQGKGVFAAVVEESVEPTEFSSYIEGAAIFVSNGLYESIFGGETIYGARIAQDKTVEELQTTYTQIVSSETVKEIYKSQLLKKAEGLASHLIQSILEKIEEMTAEIFGEQLGYLSGLLESLGIDMSETEYLCELPQTVEEYREKIKGYYEQDFTFLQERNELTYTKEREVLSQNTYDAWQENIRLEYGSLTGYWEFLKNK